MRGNRARDNHSQFETVGLTYCNDMATSTSALWWKSEEDIAKKSENVFINQHGVKKLAEKVCFFLQNFDIAHCDNLFLNFWRGRI